MPVHTAPSPQGSTPSSLPPPISIQRSTGRAKSPLNVQKGTASAGIFKYIQAMMSNILRRFSKLGPNVGNLAASATGCFIFTPGFRLVAMKEEGSETQTPTRADDGSPGLSTGIGAAVFLMVFITSEALATIVALHR